MTALPRLLDRKQVAAELGVGRATVDAIFRACPVVLLDGLRKPMVYEEDVVLLLEQSTMRDSDGVRKLAVEAN